VSNTDAYCIETQNGACVSCAGGYNLSPNGTCLLADPLCKTVDSIGSCTSCCQRYSLSSHTCTIKTFTFRFFWPSLAPSVPPVARGISASKVFSSFLIVCAPRSTPLRVPASAASQATYHLRLLSIFEPSKAPIVSLTLGILHIKCAKGYLVQNFVCAQVDPKCICLNPREALA